MSVPHLATRSLPVLTPLRVKTFPPAGGSVRVLVAGELDLATVPRLQSALAAAIGDRGPDEQIRVDLAGVSFLDATGIGALLDAAAAAARAKVRLVVCNPGGMIRRLLEITGADVALGVPPPQPATRPGTRHRSAAWYACPAA